MKITIQKINIKLQIKPKEEKKEGYAFLDKYNHCTIITYGETNKKSFIEFFNN